MQLGHPQSLEAAHVRVLPVRVLPVHPLLGTLNRPQGLSHPRTPLRRAAAPLVPLQRDQLVDLVRSVCVPGEEIPQPHIWALDASESVGPGTHLDIRGVTALL